MGQRCIYNTVRPFVHFCGGGGRGGGSPSESSFYLALGAPRCLSRNWGGGVSYFLWGLPPPPFFCVVFCVLFFCFVCVFCLFFVFVFFSVFILFFVLSFVLFCFCVCVCFFSCLLGVIKA